MEKQWIQCQTLFSWAPKSLQMMTAAMKLKDICSWKKSYDQPRQLIKEQRHYFATKVHLVKTMEKVLVTYSQYSCLENPRDGGAWWAAIYGVAQSQTRLKQLSSSTSSSSRLIIAFLPRNKCLLISWLQSPSAVILESPKIKFLTVSIVFPSICHEVMGPDAMIFIFLNVEL